MFLGIMPDWVGDTLSVLGPALGLPAIISIILTRRNANRKLQVEEGGLKVSEFEALRTAYREDRLEAEATADTLRNEINGLRDDLDAFREMVRSLRSLFQRVVTRAEVTLTAGEQREFEATRPPVRRRPR